MACKRKWQRFIGCQHEMYESQQSLGTIEWRVHRASNKRRNSQVARFSMEFLSEPAAWLTIERTWLPIQVASTFTEQKEQSLLLLAFSSSCAIYLFIFFLLSFSLILSLTLPSDTAPLKVSRFQVIDLWCSVDSSLPDSAKNRSFRRIAMEKGIRCSQ